MRPAKTQISLGIRPVWSEFLLCAQWVAKDPSFLHADGEDSDQTGRMPRLIRVFAGRTRHFLVLSWGGSIYEYHNYPKFADRQVWENSVDPDRSNLIRVYTVCHYVRIFWVHDSMVKVHCYNFRIITAIYSGVQIFRSFTVWDIWCKDTASGMCDQVRPEPDYLGSEQAIKRRLSVCTDDQPDLLFC